MIRAELLHRDHMSSPLGSTTPKSLSDRILEAVKRSIERRDYIERNMKAAAAAGSGLESWVSAGEGEYFMEIALGSPPQTLITIVDTGSDLVWVQCSPCSACFPQTGPNFEPAKSKTYRTASCDDRLCLVQQLPLHNSLLVDRLLQWAVYCRAHILPDFILLIWLVTRDCGF